MKNGSYKENPKNCYTNFNKLHSTSIKFNRNQSIGQILFSEPNIPSLKNSQLLITNNQTLTQDPYLNFFNTKKTSEVKKFKKISIPPIIFNEEKNNFINFNPERRISNSKSGYCILTKENQISFLENLLIPQNRSGNLLNLSSKNLSKNLKCNTIKQYSESVTNNKSNDILKYYQKNKIISQSSSHLSFKNKKDKDNTEKYKKFNKIKNNKTKKKIQKYTPTNASVNNNHFQFITNYKHKNSFNDINNNYQFLYSKAKSLDKNKIVQSDKNNIDTNYNKISKWTKNTASMDLINEIVYLKKAIAILQLFFKEKYFYYFIEKFLQFISELISANESKNFFITHEYSKNSCDKNKKSKTKYPTPQIFHKESVNSFKIYNNNLSKNFININYEVIGNKLKKMAIENKNLKIKQNTLTQDNRDLIEKIKNKKTNPRIFTNLSIQNVNNLNIKNIKINSLLLLKKVCAKNIFLIISNHIKILLLNVLHKFQIQKLANKEKKIILNDKMIKLREIKLIKMVKIKEEIYKRIFLKYLMKFYFGGLLKYMNDYYGNIFFKTSGRLININEENEIIKLTKLRKAIIINFKYHKNLLRKNFFIFYSRGIIFNTQKLIFSPLKNKMNNNINTISKLKETCYIQELIKEKKLKMVNILKKIVQNKEKYIFLICKTIFIKWQCRTKIISIIDEDKAKKKKRRIQRKINKKNSLMKSEEISKNKKKSNTSNTSKSYDNLQNCNSFKLISFVQKIVNVYKIYFIRLLQKQKKNKNKNDTIEEEKINENDDEIDFYVEDSSVLSDY